MLLICTELVDLPLDELKDKLTKHIGAIEEREAAWSR